MARSARSWRRAGAGASSVGTPSSSSCGRRSRRASRRSRCCGSPVRAGSARPACSRSSPSRPRRPAAERRPARRPRAGAVAARGARGAPRALGAPPVTRRSAAPDGRLVLLIDAYERLGALDDWVRTGCCRACPPARSRSSPAGSRRARRGAPTRRGATCCGSWRCATSAPEESRSYLRACGVDDGRARAPGRGDPWPPARAVAARRRRRARRRGDRGPAGPRPRRHPGAAVRRRRPGRAAARRPGGLRAGPGDHRAAAAGRARRCEDAHELFAWLRDLSFVEAGPDGLFPHDLARDVLDADLRWRDPDGYKAPVPARPRPHLRRPEVVAGARAAARGLRPEVRLPQPPERPVAGRLGRLGPPLPRARGPRGPRAASSSWWRRPRARRRRPSPSAGSTGSRRAFFVVRGEGDDVRGFLALLDLTAASEPGPPRRPGRAGGVGLRPPLRAAPAGRGDHADPVRHRPRGLPGPVADAERRPDRDPAAVPGAPRGWRGTSSPCTSRSGGTTTSPSPTCRGRAGADFVVGGRRYGLFGHDFRRGAGRRADGAVDRAGARPGRHAAAGGARATCWCCRRRTSPTPSARRCATCTGRSCWPATRCCARACAHDYAGTERAGRRGARGACSAPRSTRLRQHPRDDKLLRAVERTYLRPAPTQEAAAELLGLPFSTYRRHLSQGVGRIVAWLWERELYGAAPGPAEHR